MVDRFFERLARMIELALALAFIVAVGLNFANVIGRYLFGRMMLGADEVQIYIMVWMVFLGAAVVSWRRQHLRMDVVVRYLPSGAQIALRWLERLLLLVLAGFVLSQSLTYAWRIFDFGQTSNTAHIPMWIPHSAVWIGFGLIGIIAVWRALQAALSHGRLPREESKP